MELTTEEIFTLAGYGGKKAPEEKEVVIKPWGKYETIYIGSEFKIKVITVNPNHRLSLQRHRWRAEHWYVVKGVASCLFQRYEHSEDYFWTPDLQAGTSYNIQKGQWHRVENKQATSLQFVEVQTGDCFEEDIERKEDDYGRV